MSDERLFILLRIVLWFVRPHHHGVPGNLHAVRKLRGGLVTPLRIAVFLRVALPRSVVLPQGAAGEAKFCDRTSKPTPTCSAVQLWFRPRT